ncbi:MAG: hypothetical protein HC939_03835 [Pleurocapsa sp. SU_5_0]|nr:hypothetical protein [Pleurocapsa sp. SU_5_0]NJO94998.1 hypothetical protein [Pleurocapsa sp. CRU_1_2]NJR46380.1 hypothetical protein [Hyellaceae cyanobacterium CSU_1_1]
MSNEILLVQAASAQNSLSKLPNSSQVINALLKLEKDSKQEQKSYSLANLAGVWNLRLITGTKKTRKKAGVILGAGKYIPQFIKIQITYKVNPETAQQGEVINSVKLAFFELSLTGPIKFLPQRRILAFDFTYLKVSLWGWNLYQGYIQNGLLREKNFLAKELKDQAFFKYFLIRDNFIAARGRGGGLALWSRDIAVQS